MATERFTAADVPDQAGRTALVTGANTGIGYEAALVLAGNTFFLWNKPARKVQPRTLREPA